jgi:hypothetical protein
MPVSIKPTCPSGHVLRESYKTSSGKCSPSRCVRKTGILTGKSSVRAEKHYKEAKENSKAALKMRITR